MIVYNPLDGLNMQGSPDLKPKQCFLMTRLGNPIPEEVSDIRQRVTEICADYAYEVIDANARVTGRDFLLKIWRLISETPLSIGIVHKDIPLKTQANIFYELGVAQALGKETLIIKCNNSDVPSDFVRTEYVEFNRNFEGSLRQFMDGLFDQANYYETVADQLERNPLLAIDYLRRAFLITGNESLKQKTITLLDEAGLENRARNSVEILAAAFANG